MSKALESQGDTIHPKSAKEAHDGMVDLMDAALAEGRSAILVTMKSLLDGTINMGSGIMNLDQHDKGLLMVAFLVVRMNEKSESDIKEDMFTLGEFVGKLLN